MIEHPMVTQINRHGYPRGMNRPLHRRVEEAMDTRPIWKKRQDTVTLQSHKPIREGTK